MRYLSLLLVFGIAACADDSTLSTNCIANGTAIREAAVNYNKLTPAERSTVDTQIAASNPYCSGTVPSDVAGANKAVLASTTKIAAAVAAAKAR